MELLLHSIKLDWPVLLPILLCSILTVAVAINRFSFYNKNKRDVVKFIRGLKTELVNNRLDAAKELASIAEEQKKKAEQAKVASEEKPAKEISIEDFAKVELKVGEIIAAQKHENAQNLLVLQVKIGDETRQIVSGIAKFYDPQNIIGKKIVVVTNLKPAVIRGVESKGMILCAVENAKQKDEKLEILEVKELSNKAIVR